jgi:hypothetical protein
MTTFNNIFLGAALDRNNAESGGPSLFNHRVVSRPAPATVYVEKHTNDPLVARLEDSLKRTAELQQLQQSQKILQAQLTPHQIPAINTSAVL